MSDQQTFFTRVGKWFRKSGNGNGDLPLSHDTSLESRSTFLRPFTGQKVAIARLQESFETLNDLMHSIRDNMDRQSKRQDELLAYMSHLPEALQSLPETSRAQSQALQAIHQQLEQQNTQQEKLSEILAKMSETGGEQRDTLNEVRERIENIRETDEAISANLNSLGSALQNVSRNSMTGAQVLEQMRDRIDSRDGQLERILHRQGTRHTAMLAVTIFLSISALTAVCIMGYLLIIKKV